MRIRIDSVVIREALFNVGVVEIPHGGTEKQYRDLLHGREPNTDPQALEIDIGNDAAVGVDKREPSEPGSSRCSEGAPDVDALFDDAIEREQMDDIAAGVEALGGGDFDVSGTVAAPVAPAEPVAPVAEPDRPEAEPPPLPPPDGLPGPELGEPPVPLAPAPPPPVPPAAAEDPRSDERFKLRRGKYGVYTLTPKKPSVEHNRPFGAYQARCVYHRLFTHKNSR